MHPPSAPFPLTPIERAVLVNPLEVRKALAGGSDDFDESMVLDVLAMFQATHGYVREHPDDLEMAAKTDLRFAGVNGKTGLGPASFTRFLVLEQRKLAELLVVTRKNDATSHVPMAETYRSLLALRNDVPEKGRLTRETMRRLSPLQA